ncbi:MAG: trypsin-like peptidase domain-containing protein [Thalassovita sp.]|nr:trypsin-like peptidase domain-containing protein [Thalassovita sp.]
MLRILTIILLFAAAPLAAETRIPQNNMEIQLGFAPLVKKAAPAVVNIYAKRIVQARQSPFQNDPFFRDLFRDFGEVRPQVQNSLGSGVILSADGYVVSNFHVVGDAAEIRVVLNDRREFDARVLLADEEADLAILKLDGARDMPFLDLRDSDDVEVGELVLAVGNPFGVGQTVSSGIVSGLARSGTATGNGRGYFIQTDAPINPGNSGGALIDVNGQLIGVNTSILTRSGGSNGIGFAIPSNLVAQFVKQARQGQDRFQRPWAGMTGQTVDADIAAGRGLDRPGGIVVSDLHRASPFLKAGVEPGDVILAVDGEPVNTPPEMIFRMSVAGLREEVNVAVFRNGSLLDISVRLIAAPDTPARDRRVLADDTALPGLELSNINPAVLADYGLPLSMTGVVVDNPGPYGARIGLQPGDILREINGKEMDATGDVEGALSNLSRLVTFDVQRGLQRLVIRFRL